MIAVDTNVVVRLIVANDPDQLAIAHRLASTEVLFVPLTVTLECEWVLRSFYKFARDDIATAMLLLTDLESMVFEQADAVRWALARLVAGADFADMIHLVQSPAARASAFATFDAGIADDAGDETPLPVRTLT